VTVRRRLRSTKHRERPFGQRQRGRGEHRRWLPSSGLPLTYWLSVDQPRTKGTPMKRSILASRAFYLLSMCLVSPSAVWAQGQRTHLEVPSSRIINLSTFCMTNDNTSRPYFYDRASSAPFSMVPEGFSFVITDIIIDPCGLQLPKPTDKLLVVVSIGCCRSFSSGYREAVTQHYPLTGGFVIPEGTSVAGRNTTFSTTGAEVQLLGYFVRGPGLGVGLPFPFTD
jgi:hypothetical protein